MRQRQHGAVLQQSDRRELERIGWRTTLEFRENNTRGRDGRLLQVEEIWHAEAERELMARILREESQLRAQCRRSGTPLVLIRPTLVYGCGLDRNLSRLVRFGDRTGFIPVSSAADGLRQPVHAADLADLADAALGADTGGILEGPACGAEQLSYRAMVHRAAACCRRRVRCPEWPPRLLAAAAGLAGRLLGSSGINAQMVYRQAEDLVFDDHVFRSRLGYRPRPFRPTRADFSIPRELLRYRLPG